KKRRPRGNVTLAAGHMPTITADEAAEFTGVLLDARAPERYRGEFEPLDSRAGHIAGAGNAPFADNVTHLGTIRSEKELRDRFSAIGAVHGRPVAAYCRSGVNATHHIPVLSPLGAQAPPYPASWSQWPSATRPSVEVGRHGH